MSSGTPYQSLPHKAGILQALNHPWARFQPPTPIPASCRAIRTGSSPAAGLFPRNPRSRTTCPAVLCSCFMMLFHGLVYARKINTILLQLPAASCASPNDVLGVFPKQLVNVKLLFKPMTSVSTPSTSASVSPLEERFSPSWCCDTLRQFPLLWWPPNHKNNFVATS